MATLEGQTILIVGGTSGIGLAVAKLSILSSASHVIVASSTKEKVDSAVLQLNEFVSQSNGKGGSLAKITGEVVDARVSAEVRSLCERIGEIDHLVWTSGDLLGPTTPKVLDVDLDTMRHAFDLRFWGVLEAAKAAKIKKNGSIVLTIGTLLIKPMKGRSLLTGVIGAVDAITRGLAVDLAPIRVNVVCPGYVNTSFVKPSPERESMYKAVAEKLLVQHVAEPEEVAEAYLFLMKCGYITGQRIEVDGGILLA